MKRIVESSLKSEGFIMQKNEWGVPYWYKVYDDKYAVIINWSRLSFNGKSFHKPKVVINNINNEQYIEIIGLKWIESIVELFNVFDKNEIPITHENLIAENYINLQGFGEPVYGKVIRKGFGNYITIHDDANELYASMNKHYQVADTYLTHIDQVYHILEVIDKDFKNYK